MSISIKIGLFLCAVFFGGQLVEAIAYSGTWVGVYDTSATLGIAVSLAWNNQSGLAQLLEDLYNPNSPLHHKYLTAQEFNARFSPTAAQLASVTSWLSQQSIKVSAVDESGILIHGSATVGALNTAFQTEICYYVDSNNVSFYQPKTDYILPSGIFMYGVHGLDNRTQRVHHSRVGALQPRGTYTSSNLRANSVQQGLLTPADIRTAYNIQSNFDGSGQIGGLVEFDTYNPADIASYAKTFGITEVPLFNVPISVDGQAAPTTPGSGQTEVTLDIQLFNAMAPGLQQLRVYIAPNSGAATLAMYSQIANDNLATVVSTSWGINEGALGTSELNAEAAIYQKMAAQGQSLFSAAGDNGAFDAGGDTTPAVDDPASQPFVTGVGGTSLTLNGNKDFVKETTWLTSETASGTEGGGGGVSQFHALPSYQVGVISAASKGSTSFRNVPDVSLEADPNVGYIVIVTPPGQSSSEVEVGGTSCAAPIWSGLMTLVNQARASNNLPVIGFFNPTLYRTAQGSNYSSLFHDVNDGSTNGLFPAVTGYDLATGWGSFNGNPLLAQLSGGTLAPGTPVSESGSGSNSGGTSDNLSLPVLAAGIAGAIFVAVGVAVVVVRTSRRRQPIGGMPSRPNIPNGHLVTSVPGQNVPTATALRMSHVGMPGDRLMTSANPRFQY